MYQIIGADQREYGPVSADQVREWIAARRADKDTRIRAEGAIVWKRLEELPEFADALTPAGVPAPASPPGAPGQPCPAKEGKTSRLAIASLVLGMLGILSCGVTALIGLVLGIVALVRINRGGGAQKGQGVAIAGIAVSAAFLLFMPVMAGIMLPALAKAKSQAQSITCMNNLKQLALGALMYANDYNDQLPPADAWCDAVLKYTAGSEAVFHCPSGAPGQRCHYGYNARLTGKSLASVKDPDKVVLFFEVDGGWNVSGGPELMLASPRHARARGVAYLDGHCVMIRNDSREIENLRWDPGTP
ncbi:MAG TPA: DUF4190 domain-containing protein [Verrucomicrobiota bacterium]|nr:DUF4190 domain-containing protein [Verrucomicrobiota bacterium]